jgi:hypothetical protein
MDAAQPRLVLEESLWLDLDVADFAANGIINDYRTTPLLHCHGVRRACRDDHGVASANAPRFLTERQVCLSVNDVPYLFVGM